MNLKRLHSAEDLKLYMSRLSNLKKSNPNAPMKILIYGIEGVGKSTFASEAPSPIFISPEGGVDHINGAVEMPDIKTWYDLLAAIKELATVKHDFKTLVLDTADWIEKLCHAQIIGNSDKSIATVNGGYGAGYREAENMHRELIERLTDLRDRVGMNVIITSHYNVRQVKDPEAVSDYDSYQIKCHELVSSLWREWVDCVFFARFKTLQTKAGEKTVTIGDGERVMYTQHRPAFQAKNRYGLPFEMPVKFSAIMDARVSLKPSDEIKSSIEELLENSGKPEEFKAKVRAALEKAGDDSQNLARVLAQLKAATQK